MTDQPASRISQRRAAAKNQSGPDYSAKRAELIRVAAGVFLEKGYAATTLNDVAAIVGTDRASVYYYFSSKEELFQECVTGTVVSNLRSAEEILGQKLPPRETLHQLIAMLVESQAEHYPDMYVYMQEDITRAAMREVPWAKAMVEHTHRMERVFIDVIGAGVKDGSFRSDLSVTLVANSLFGMTQWTHRWWVPSESRYGADDLVKVFSATLFEGIEPRP